MSLFGSKSDKKEGSNIDLGSLPPLPEFPSLDSPGQSVPSYTPTVARPVQKSAFQAPPMPPRPQVQRMPMPPRPAPRMMGSGVSEGEKPLFIKIDRYKSALKAIDNLKTKIKDAEDVLNDIEEVRTQEEQKLDSWRKDLNEIKDKVLSIDQNLFEV